jgi:ribonuclease HII
VSRRPSLSEECKLWARGHTRVTGLDEAGRGAWAGPVVAAAVILPPQLADQREVLELVRDSKLLTPSQRDVCYDLVLAHALAFGVGIVPAGDIDRIGVVPATREAMRQAISALPSVPDYLLIDFLRLPQVSIPQLAMPKGDRRCLSIAAASVVAKVTRDRWMVSLNERVPGYGLARHKGYGTSQHLAALRSLGPTSHHRHSFAPIRAIDEATSG